MAANSPKASIEIGTLIGDYKVTSLRHQGTRADVYRAEHTRFLRQAAIKIIDRPVEDSAHRTQLEKLLGTVNQVRHANLVELYDFGFLEDSRLYLVQEWVDGYCLADSDAAIWSMPLDDKVAFLQSIASAIDEVHLSSLGLPGLAPAHVLVESKRGRAKLIAYAFTDACEDMVAGESPDKNGATHASRGASDDFKDFGRIVEKLLLSGKATVSGENAEKIEVIIARCLLGEASDQFKSGKDIIVEIKAALGLEGPKRSSLAIGTLVGESYKITGVIGKGGMGQVYEAEHVRLPQRVAIKVIEGSFTEEANIRFRQEAEIAASIGHPHLVRVIDFNTFEDGQPYMVMELLEGEDLGKSMRYGPLSPKRAIEIAKQVGSALSAVHKKGIVHRDLKPPNVFLGKVAVGGEIREHATVLDFGVSKREDATTSVTKTSAVVGTPQYMAPEQALGENDTLTAKADQFSLGSLLYEMLSGAPAFGRGTLAEVVYRVCQEEPPPLKLLFPDLPQSVSDAVERAMSKRASDRFDSVANFVAALSVDEVSDVATAPLVSLHGSRGSSGDSESSSAATVANKKSDVVAPASASADTAVAGSQTRATGASEAAAVAAAKTSSVAATEATAVATETAPLGVSARSKLGIAALLVLALGAAALALVVLTGGERKEDAREARKSRSQQTQDLLVPEVIATPALASDGAMPEQDGGPVQEVFNPYAADAGTMDVDPPFVPADAGAIVADARPSTKEPNTATERPPVQDSALSADIVAKLDEAEALIKAGRYLEARRVVSRHKRAAATTRGRALAVKSYCGENNFGAAQDWLRRVPKSERRAVIAYCKNNHQIELN